MQSHLPFSREEKAWRSHHFGLTRQIARQAERIDRHQQRHDPGARGIVASAIPPGAHGFDVSSYQPAAPNFRSGGRGFAIFKATESTGYFDPHFNANRGAAHAQGCVGVGIYHFARPGSTSPDAQANWFLGHVGGRKSGEFGVVDYEVPPWNPDWAARYIQILNQHGWPCAFYSYAGMISPNPTVPIAAATPFLWIAGYSCNPPGSDRWPHWTLWQHTDGSGSVGCNDGPWDCSVSYDPLFSQLTGGGSPPIPTPTPVPVDIRPKLVTLNQPRSPLVSV